jgi:hypothetical protein
LFRVKESEGDGGPAVSEWVVQIALLCGLLANFGCVFLIWREYQQLSAALDRPEPMPLARGAWRPGPWRGCRERP